MALTAYSSFSYGITVTTGSNDKIDFETSASAEVTATLTPGYYSLTTIAIEVARAMIEADPTHTYTITVNRSNSRITITTSFSYLTLLFGTGTNAATSAASLLGFTGTDKSGATAYTGASSCGTLLTTSWFGSNFLAPEHFQVQFGSVNISANGQKEAIVYPAQTFWQVQFKYITKALWTSSWYPLMQWMIAQKPIEFVPEITDTSVFYEGTLEATPQDAKGISYKVTEMLPQMPNYYDTGLMRFRVRP